jgi:tRNA dimethylallyltransferase
VGLVVIQGPTASGKSELAIRLAEKVGGEIINADSMQVYSRMDIGTAKPPLSQLERVPHHLIGIVSPEQDFSAADFRREAIRSIAGIVERGKRCIVVGGTGLYIRALLQGLVDSPRGNTDMREALRQRALRDGNASLLEELGRVDPDTATHLHPNDLVRIVRALEVYYQTGIPISRYRAGHGFKDKPFSVLKLGIALQREELYQRIDRRVDAMISDGLVEEVKGLLASGLTPDMKPMRSIGYKEICSMLNGELILEDALLLIKQNTRRYAKRQMTWFKKDHEINWVEYPDSFATICNHVIEFFVKGEDYGKSTL